MIAAKTALSATVILATLGLAGCQTTEERVYYSSASPVVSTTYVYDEGRYVYRRPPSVYVVPPPRYIRPPAHPPRFYGGPTPDPRGRRFYNGPTRDPYGRRLDGRHRWPQGTNGNAPGYDTQ